MICLTRHLYLSYTFYINVLLSVESEHQLIAIYWSGLSVESEHQLIAIYWSGLSVESEHQLMAIYWSGLFSN